MPVDPKVLEWFGHMLLLSAQNLEQAEKLSEWFRAGFPWGPDQKTAWEPLLRSVFPGAVTGSSELNQALKSLFAAMGLVPVADFLALEKKCAALQLEIDQLKRGQPGERPASYDFVGQAFRSAQSLSEANARLFEQWQKSLLIPTESEKKK
jgi:hypothetical protein